MRFCFHDWLPWSRIVPTYNSGHKQQWRVCKKCNKAKFRTLCWDKQSDSGAINSALYEATAQDKEGK